VNGREKKIAIIENERVTEFYIERGEQNQGIVGNLYKGRVMRVLPGMQSAFVDIGLERDAFLYVSDFFDEEAEFERIVVDSTKKGDAATAQKDAAAQIEQARIERDHLIEATHKRVGPLAEGEVEPAAVVEEAETETEETGARRRGRRGGRGRRRTTGGEPAREERSLVPHEPDEIDTPFGSAASFERVSDDEERVANGEMLKDARLQERIMDEVHAVEFDLEDVPSAPVGSLLSDELRSSGEFQRVKDSEETEVTGVAAPRELESAHVRDFVDEVVDESSRQLSFQRVSDDEEAVSQVEAAPARRSPRQDAPASPRSRKKTGVISRFFKTKKEESAAEETEPVAEVESAPEVNADSEASITTGRAHEEFATRRGGRRRRRPTKTAGPADADGANGQDEQGEETVEAAAPEAFEAPEEEQATADEAPVASEAAEPSAEASPRAPPPPGRTAWPWTPESAE
jgi:ribonuclease G